MADLTAALSAELTLLAEALDRPREDLVERLHQLVEDARSVADSYLGLTLVIEGAAPFALTLLEQDAAAAQVQTSLLIPLGGSDRAPAPSHLVVYAGRSGAFVDLAADLSWLTGTSPSGFVLDQHLPPALLSGSDRTLRDTSAVNQAIGLLIGRGHDPEQARAELDALALAAGTDARTEALRLLDEHEPGADDDVRV